MLTLKDDLSEVIAVLPAAGNGSRMQVDRPKQYLNIGNKTILEHTLDALFQHPRIRRAIIAISPDDDYFQTLPLASDPRIQVVQGGRQRADSVLAGLQQVQGVEWVLVHDAARPCLHPDDLARLLELTSQSDVGGILAAPVRDTMKRSNAQGDIEHTVERNALWHALTPQLFPLMLLKNSLEHALSEGAEITDEASALEFCGYHPQIVSGRADNIKVTRQEDLALAEFYLTRNLKNQTIV
ncbi:2-C-methyl-D-erythritol 4-phosphate cytidylyltransferase [Lonsdalea populi]|uniref:2-C-methyl-D-erythritol 4-phosphate cytidylyltransferase n=1 Tax=Lonsdalea populi TaxID=1172565 RepID=A0A3N0UQA1_9GAMM|nr:MULTISPECIES: 2-C-methyl-D-erythritol 4-phosphate cytidylyltransferase [Lonsdalea]OSN01560.1 2-C-methyl-D-erythritol 4-phosphate cytidylyltransferase [Lonsdalea populi]QPQ24813.1 2-C-methyl-D-erythritol 4-phosphate cytidylyltransferase [Lonsdalea populi]RAT16916.1 2-C-methyl-D-erythritol 4-phosphate cytidylyltransferase [Lonsdalea quercina]RAT29023.1 2-C-methyl-D-erythritol 4-phosphate cytidylyltransferase [Lonsdalea populi]RAT34488.1 2-C-methyl-D-erythritol 4-phosphate cytidylyltransferase